jgi:hypothetical protein
VRLRFLLVTVMLASLTGCAGVLGTTVRDYAEWRTAPASGNAASTADSTEGSDERSSAFDAAPRMVVPVTGGPAIEGVPLGPMSGPGPAMYLPVGGGSPIFATAL